MEVSGYEKEVSSAEITGVYRCAIPEYSGDTLSALLVSEAGKRRANAFIEKYQYPLVNQKISLRAGYFLTEALRLLNSGLYDACISFASGFSLLMYFVAQRSQMSNIQYFDTDFEHMIQERQKRISQVNQLDQKILSKIQLQACDVEQMYKENLSLKTRFPTCHRPVFIGEGLTYFLSPGCVEWLITEIGSYSQSATIVDYWPEDMLNTSALFARVFPDLNQGMILEPLKSFWSVSTINHFKGQFARTTDYSLREIEQRLSLQLTMPRKPEMLDLNQYFPLRMIAGEK